MIELRLVGPQHTLCVHDVHLLSFLSLISHIQHPDDDYYFSFVWQEPESYEYIFLSIDLIDIPFQNKISEAERSIIWKMENTLLVYLTASIPFSETFLTF
jgi:hypothetical protein